MKDICMLIFIAVILVGCGGKTETTTSTYSTSTFDRTKTPIEKAPYLTVSNSNDTGEGSARTYQENMVTTYFDKKIDMGHLNSVGKTNVSTTLSYIKSNLQINLYRMDCSRYYCGNSVLTSLDGAPSFIENYWENQFSDDEKEGYTILGLYLPEGKDIDGVTLDKGTILFNYEAKRKTVVHEFMHHLFFLQKNDDNSIVDKFVKVRADMLASIELFQADITPQNLEDLLHKADLYFNIARKFVVSYPLEEATIERIILEKISKSELDNMPGKSKYASLDYGGSSIGKAKEIINHIQGLNQTIKNKIIPGMLFSKDEKDILMKMANDNLQKIDRFNLKLNSFSSWYRREGYIPYKASKIKAIMGDRPMGCGHTHKPVETSLPPIRI